MNKLKILILFTLLVGCTIGIYMNYKAYNSPGTILFTGETPVQDTINKKFSYISGEVKNPGIYEIVDGMRISDLILLAGGVTETADSNFVNQNINLAEKLKDEQAIFIPALVESTSTISTNYDSSELVTEADLVNLNTATVDELDSLPGVGPSTAEKIIDARPFSSIENLLDVPGLGESKYNELKDLVTI